MRIKYIDARSSGISVVTIRSQISIQQFWAKLVLTQATVRRGRSCRRLDRPAAGHLRQRTDRLG